MKKFFVLFLIIQLSSSCITPPPGVCAYNDAETGTITVIDIEATEDINSNCPDRRLVTLRFTDSNGKTWDDIHKQDYPGKFIIVSKIEKGKTYKGVREYELTNLCNHDLFSFADFPLSYSSICSGKYVPTPAPQNSSEPLKL